MPLWQAHINSHHTLFILAKSHFSLFHTLSQSHQSFIPFFASISPFFPSSPRFYYPAGSGAFTIASNFIIHFISQTSTNEKWTGKLLTHCVDQAGSFLRILIILSLSWSRLAKINGDGEREREGDRRKEKNVWCRRVSDVVKRVESGPWLGLSVQRELGSVTQFCDADACGHSLQFCPVNQESSRAQTLLPLYKRQDHNNERKRGQGKRAVMAWCHILTCPSKGFVAMN